MTIIDDRVIRQSAEVRQRMMHFFRCAFEESTTAGLEEGVSAQKGRPEMRQFHAGSSTLGRSRVSPSKHSLPTLVILDVIANGVLSMTRRMQAPHTQTLTDGKRRTILDQRIGSWGLRSGVGFDRGCVRVIGELIQRRSTGVNGRSLSSPEDG